MTNYVLYVGIVAGICTAISLLPQLFKIIKTRKAEGISMVMLIILMLGIIGWITYGIMKDDYPIIITNSFSFLINVLIIIFSVKYKQGNSS